MRSRAGERRICSLRFLGHSTWKTARSYQTAQSGCVASLSVGRSRDLHVCEQDGELSVTLFAIEYPSVLGSAFIFFIAVGYWFLYPTDRKRAEWLIAASCLAIPADAVCQAVTVHLSRMVPLKLDQYIYVMDGLFGQPSFVLGRIAERHLWLEITAQVAYGLLPCAVLVLWAAYLWLGTEALFVLRVFVLNLFLAVPIYFMVPVCGPAFAFAHFPFGEPDLVPHRIPILAPPNGIPSVHTSTALLILWFAWRWPIGRILGLIYLALIAFSTLASGQHYLVDLLAAVPYAFGVYILASKSVIATKELLVDTEGRRRYKLKSAYE
jgi:membrane-associated phospholipid phosphatase